MAKVLGIDLRTTNSYIAGCLGGTLPDSFIENPAGGQGPAGPQSGTQHEESGFSIIGMADG